MDAQLAIILAVTLGLLAFASWDLILAAFFEDDDE